MKRLLQVLVFMILTCASAFAQDVIVETNPRNPIKGEPFQILFKCQTSKATDPEITFDAEGFEVLGRQSQGMSTRTIYQNGKIQVFRELMISYEALAPKAGRINLKNVVVVLDGKRMTQDTVGIQVLEAPLEPKLVFIGADVPKKSLYVGEGMTVRYYIYVKAHLQAYDLKKFPNLTGFMKRFIQEGNDVQHVTVEGERFRRSVIYTARLYPEKEGKLTIDPLEVSATYGVDPFGGLGFSFGGSGGQMKTRLIKSEAVEIDVKPLPSAGRPASFNGLVGRHSFDLKANRASILVNEPIEPRLTINGPGNLESLEAPDLWTVPQLERFDAKSDLSMNGTESAIKTFDYTYLGKVPGEVPSREIEFSYFDPSSMRYEVIKRKLPEILVGGSAAAAAPSKPKAQDSEKAPESKNDPDAPVTARPWANPVIWISVLALGLAVGLGLKTKSWLQGQQQTRPAWESDMKSLEKQGPTSALLTRLLHAFAPDSTRPLTQILAESKLPKPSQDYFMQLLMQLERREFATKRPAGDIVLDKKHLQELKKALKGV